jgi:hypothetical protein
MKLGPTSALVKGREASGWAGQRGWTATPPLYAAAGPPTEGEHFLIILVGQVQN